MNASYKSGAVTLLWTASRPICFNFIFKD